MFSARYHLLKASLLEDYEPFDPHRELPSELPDSKLMLLEDRFLSNFRHTMEKANFSMLTGKDAATAASSNFLNTVPIVPEWLKMDPLFQRYMEQHPEMMEDTYEGILAVCDDRFFVFVTLLFSGSNRLWIFHRGVGVAHASGVLFMQKLDALMLRMFGRCCGKKKKDGKDDKGKEEMVPLDKSQGQGVERISISSIVKVNGWKALFKSQTIQEATFKEVFLVYRINHLRDPQMGSGNTRGIYIKSFRDIPHADLEGWEKEKLGSSFFLLLILSVLSLQNHVSQTAGCCQVETIFESCWFCV